MAKEKEKKYIKPEDVPEEEIKRILYFLNTVKKADEIADGVEFPGERDVGIKVAQHILKKREKIGKFTNLKQVDKIKHVGPERFTEIVMSLRSYKPKIGVDNMNGINIDNLIGRPESTSSLVRFEDKTDEHAPKLNYAVPLPSSFEGRFFLETDFGTLPWNDEALEGEDKTKEIADGVKSGGGIVRILDKKPEILYWAAKPHVMTSPTIKYQVTNPGLKLMPTILPIKIEEQDFIRVHDYDIPATEIESEAVRNRALVVYRTFGGSIHHTYVPEAKDKASANPRFVIIQHYQLSSHFGDYGAGRTIKTFTLWPGEETTLYIRSWRRTEERSKEASTIFDSFTKEAADEFERNLETESSYREEYQKTKEWKAEGGFSLNLGIAKIGGGGGGGGSSKESTEYFSKCASKVSRHHASKASAKRETTISTELESFEASEFETITERHVKNVNLSRVLNLVCRELNQEFKTYLTQIDVSIAFVNDRHVYEEVPIYDIDRLLAKFLKNAWDGNTPAGADPDPRKYVKKLIWEQISSVYDFQGNSHQFVEEVDNQFGRKYWRIKRRSDPSTPHPFYPRGSIPVEGIVINEDKHTIRTDAVIIDSLLGHGVALDNYALGTQQEVLRSKQLLNRKTELALEILEANDLERVNAYKSLFVDYSKSIIKEIILELLGNKDIVPPEE